MAFSYATLFDTAPDHLNGRYASLSTFGDPTIAAPITGNHMLQAMLSANDDIPKSLPCPHREQRQLSLSVSSPLPPNYLPAGHHRSL